MWLINAFNHAPWTIRIMHFATFWANQTWSITFMFSHVHSQHGPSCYYRQPASPNHTHEEQTAKNKAEVIHTLQTLTKCKSSPNLNHICSLTPLIILFLISTLRSRLQISDDVTTYKDFRWPNVFNVHVFNPIGKKMVTLYFKVSLLHVLTIIITIKYA